MGILLQTCCTSQYFPLTGPTGLHYCPTFSHISTLFRAHFRNLNPLPPKVWPQLVCTVLVAGGQLKLQLSAGSAALRLSPYLGYSLLSVATLVAFRFNSLRLIVILIPFLGQAQHCSIIFLSFCISFSIFALPSFTSLTFLKMRPGNFVF